MYNLQQAVNSTIFIFLQINSTLNSWMFCVLKPPKKFNKYTLRANIEQKKLLACSLQLVNRRLINLSNIRFYFLKELYND
ncbi:hypothetical protein A2I96_04975 [Pseudoalteromonas tetraodonis]|uniref:Transposase n=1 Tax=Pseudoalteromonas tetraodonis TaxID=43659 RepID=A0ABD4EKV0_9GAMM|nr:hypothetical protein A2I96_04975 [Pseudoalteromonas spiralis]